MAQYSTRRFHRHSTHCAFSFSSAVHQLRLPGMLSKDIQDRDSETQKQTAETDKGKTEKTGVRTKLDKGID